MKHHLKTISTHAALRTKINRWQQDGETIALVPTMGALHEGHLSLVELAKQKADRVIVSLFVNPTQFNERQDLEHYPRDEQADLEKLSPLGIDLVYSPDVNQIYPEGFSTTISVASVSQGLCGASRRGHFDGVATVVTKLLLHCTPNTAIFGEKDYQQLLVIRRLVTDLQLPVDIIGAPIIRERNGLALSSRNLRLSEKQQLIAPLLYRVLKETAHDVSSGTNINTSLHTALNQLTKAGFQVEYLELCDADTLKPMVKLTKKPARLLIAAWLGRTRLIDNIAIMS